jgi:carbon storage regulator
MLVLARKPEESIVIDGRIVVTIMRVDGDVVKLGISAPADVPVHRREVYEEILRNNQDALTSRNLRVLKLRPPQARPSQSAQPEANAAAVASTH